MATTDDILVVVIGTPGPPGTGVTAGDWSSLTGRVTTLEGEVGVTVQDEGAALATRGTTINFTGAGVTASGTGATKTVNVPGSNPTIVVKEGTTTKVAAANALSFDAAGFDVADGGGGLANVTANRAFDNTKPQYAQCFPKSFAGSPETASTTSTTTWQPAKTGSWVLPAATYTLSAEAIGTFVTDAADGGYQARLRIGGTQVDSLTSSSGQDNTTFALVGDRTGVTSDGTTAIVLNFEYLSTNGGVAARVFKPVIRAFAQRTS